jgi:hypothetical protein
VQSYVRQHTLCCFPVSAAAEGPKGCSPRRTAAALPGGVGSLLLSVAASLDCGCALLWVLNDNLRGTSLFQTIRLERLIAASTVALESVPRSGTKGRTAAREQSWSERGISLVFNEVREA